MRVVIDTNVWVSAALAPGPPRDVLKAWTSHTSIEVVMCLELYEEIAEVLLKREKIRKWLTIDEAQRYLDALRALVDFAPNPLVEEVGLRDSADSYIVALARQGRCDFIVTGDKDLLEWPDQRPTCLTPKEFLSRL